MENINSYTVKLNTYAQIISVLSKNNEIMKKVSRFQIAAEQLSSNQKKLVDLHSLLGKDISTTEKVKNTRRKELVKNTMPVIKIMQVFAHDTKKKKLQDRLEYLTSEYIQNCSDMELIKISKKIWLIANKYGGYSTSFTSKIKSTLNPGNSKAIIKFEKEYSLNSDMIKNIEDADISFIESMLLYQGEMKEKEKVAMKMKKINKQTKNLLANKIDRFVLLFESKNPGFCKEYQQLRENQEPKQSEETSNQKSLQQNIVIEEKQVNQAEPKLKPTKPGRTNPEKS